MRRQQHDGSGRLQRQCRRRRRVTDNLADVPPHRHASLRQSISRMPMSVLVVVVEGGGRSVQRRAMVVAKKKLEWGKEGQGGKPCACMDATRTWLQECLGSSEHGVDGVRQGLLQVSLTCLFRCCKFTTHTARRNIGCMCGIILFVCCIVSTAVVVELRKVCLTRKCRIIDSRVPVGCCRITPNLAFDPFAFFIQLFAYLPSRLFVSLPRWLWLSS